MIGIIGCGAMGSGMALNLVKVNRDVLCYDLSVVSRQKVEALGASVTDNLTDITDQCDIIILSLPKAEIVNSVISQCKESFRSGTIILDTSTSEPITTQALAQQLSAKGCHFIDAPLSGGPKGASTGTMTMLLGGDVDIIEGLSSLLDDMTGKRVHVGPTGSAHAAKIANNLLCAANLVLVSEMAHLANKADVDVETLMAGVNAGSGRSGVSEVNFPTWINNEAYNSGFTMGLMRKDVGLAINLAKEFDMNLPATQAIFDVWESSRDCIDDSEDFNKIYTYER